MSRLDKAIVIVGAISSGKSTLAKLISDRYGTHIASFGGFLKDYSLRSNLPVDRTSLQNLGDEFIKSEPEEFLLKVIQFSGSTSKALIFEGVRHSIILDLVKKHSFETLSIFIDVPIDVRKERYLTRNKEIDSNKSLREFEIANSHIVEMEIPALEQLCDLTISSFENQQLQTSLKKFYRA